MGTSHAQRPQETRSHSMPHRMKSSITSKNILNSKTSTIPSRQTLYSHPDNLFQNNTKNNINNNNNTSSS